METDDSTERATSVLAPPPPAPDVRSAPPRATRPAELGEDAVKKMEAVDTRRRDAVDPVVATDALEWFLADEGSEETSEPVYPIEINVSTNPTAPEWVQWHVKPMQSQRIDFLRRTFQMPVNREQRRRGEQGELDGAKFNAALVFEATVYPNLVDVLERTGKFRDGVELVLHRFRAKPLLVDQIAGQVLFYSGGDSDDVRTAREVKAAGN